MNKISAEEKQNRIEFLTEVAQRAIDHVINQTDKEHGAEQADEMRRCLSIDDQRMTLTVDYYYDFLLHQYKEKNGYFEHDEERNSGRDKLAALSAIALLTFSPINVSPYAGRSAGAAEIGEIYALFFASTVLHVGLKSKLGKSRDSLGPLPHVIVVRNMLLNLRDLGVEARKRARAGNHITSIEPLADWVIQAMQLYALKYGKIDLRFE